MTNGEAHIAFKVLMDKNSLAVSFGGSPAFLPEEIDLYLNQGIIEIVFNKFTGSNAAQVPFEGTVKRAADLEQLVKTDYQYTTVLNTGRALNCISLYGKFNEKPSIANGGNSNARKRMLFVDATLNVTGKNGLITKIPCQLTDHATFLRFMEAYNNSPWVPVPVLVFEGGTLDICYDKHYLYSTSDITVDLTYVDTPPTINYMDPNQWIVDLPDNIIMEGINRAVILALENTESTRTLAKTQLNNILE